MKRKIADPIPMLTNEQLEIIWKAADAGLRNVTPQELRILALNNVHLARLVELARGFIDSDGRRREDFGMALIGLLKRFPGEYHSSKKSPSRQSSGYPPEGVSKSGTI